LTDTGQKSLSADMAQTDIISEIETFAAQAGIAPATVTSRAVQNSRLYQRMKDGGSCTIQTAGRIRDYIAAQVVAPAPTPTQEDAA
jgi:tryptophan synthase beta subunit